jgi:hypothetical protein
MMQVFYAVKAEREMHLHAVKCDTRKSWMDYQLQLDIENLKHQGACELIARLESMCDMKIFRDPSDKKLNQNKYDLLETMAERAGKAVANA